MSTSNHSRPSTSNTSRTKALRDLLQSDTVEFLMGAHDGLSAKIVEGEGFRGIWGSGFSIAAAMGVRDCNEASWTQVVETCEQMCDATRVPILLDGDTGYGNFNNVMRLVRKCEQRGIAGICLEDKLFPKTNSFINGTTQLLASKEEFCGKIRAAKDTQTDECFSVVARTEGFIVGQPLSDVLARADAYYEAGADAILVHSKSRTSDEVVAFAQAWDRPCPLVIVPTTYGSTPSAVFEDAGISVVIWANHTLRASVNAMREVSRRIYQDHSIADIEQEVAPLADVFQLQGVDELLDAEIRYLPTVSTISQKQAPLKEFASHND
ncbi:MAG: phosphoenolpyruvate mutase [Planctomycetaceae bacterium]|nr:phosphoenolpyruvate mutase [Planctomycetales bacterium]MCB9924356.1 phosphoenolpyruvate mutase [Planctomycetaceae bacterium]